MLFLFPRWDMLVSGFRECIPAWFPSVFSIMITKLARFGRILVLFFEFLAPVQMAKSFYFTPPKQTWNPKMEVWKICFLFQGGENLRFLSSSILEVEIVNRRLWDHPQWWRKHPLPILKTLPKRWHETQNSWYSKPNQVTTSLMFCKHLHLTIVFATSLAGYNSLKTMQTRRAVLRVKDVQSQSIDVERCSKSDYSLIWPLFAIN